MSARESERRSALERKVGDKAERRMRARREGDRGIWFGLGMMGLVGWSVAIPTVLGLLVGIWLDKRLESGFSWTLTGLMLGVILGCLNAWLWVRKESRL